MSSGNGDRPLLELDGVDTFYGQIHILQNVHLHVGEAELVCLLGGNASGKSTTLKTILGLVTPRRGAVRLAGEDVTGRPTAHRTVARIDPGDSQVKRQGRPSALPGWRRWRSACLRR